MGAVPVVSLAGAVELQRNMGGESECTGDMLYKTDRRHGLHHGGEQLAFPALA
jgi:hypothetical protein